MMASDSDESDYEDARQHHDNEPDEDNFSPVSRLARASPSTNSTTSGVIVFSSSDSQGESRREESENQQQVAPDNHQQQLQQSNDENDQGAHANQQVNNVADNGNNLETAAASANNDQAMADEINPAEFEAVAARVNEEAERVLIRLQGYFRDNPNPVVVDSDDDDVDTISDDSELDFPLLNAENDGESEFKVQNKFSQLACSM